ncbi:MAG TPA: HemK2/MTQ2 family protein methyltransferase [Candidatus Thermoplasmatota archaeon]|nr:HemK2/MTQ2 family protein methyltransferase [Candidatus Thermoplasmatota archaeon]
MELEGPDGHRYFVALHDDVYRPADDSLLLAKAVHAEVRRGDRFLEVGCGAGYASLVAAHAGAKVVATDANLHAVALARHNARQNGFGLEVVETDLLAGLAGPFDVVAFNPPYLPTAPEDYVPGPLNLAFDGGADGNAVVLRFAEQVASLRPLPRCVLVVHSTLSDPDPLRSALLAAGYRNDVAAEEAHAFERLTVQRFRRTAGLERYR